MSTRIRQSMWDETIAQELVNFQDSGLQRELRPMERVTKPFLQYGDKKVFNLSSNNYLGLANHPQIKERMQKVENGAGTASSRLVIGHDFTTRDLEKELSIHKKTEAALLFSNGYMMNVGVLASLLKSTDIVLSDQYNHASIVDGIRLSGATHYRYRHNNLDHLERLLQKATEKGIGRILIVTETVFSMDGDIAPLKEIVFLKNKYGAALITDDAHGDGVFGDAGEGLVHHLGLEHEIDLHMGTFSKAYGVYGAYAAGKSKWIEYLVHTCRSLIYTTALPTCIVEGVRGALELIRSGTDLRDILKKKADFFRNGLLDTGFTILGTTQIIPLVLGDEMKTLAFSQRLLEENILAVAIRPPTVPKGSSRIRFTLMASHPWEVLEDTLATIISIGKEMGEIK